MKRTGMTAKFWASAEFQARQFCLEFGRVARTVVSVISKMRKELRKWEKPKAIKMGGVVASLPLRLRSRRVGASDASA